jgi:hypothetical protein
MKQVVGTFLNNILLLKPLSADSKKEDCGMSGFWLIETKLLKS